MTFELRRHILRPSGQYPLCILALDVAAVWIYLSFWIDRVHDRGTFHRKEGTFHGKDGVTKSKDTD